MVDPRQDLYGEQQFDYDPVGSRLLSTSEKQILLDPAGNILQESNDTQREYRYNAQNRISEYHENGQLKARYHYNSLGQRIHKAVIQADGTEAHTLFHHGQQGELLGESRLNNNDTSKTSHTQNIVWLQMRPVVALDSSADDQHSPRIAWLHSDHLLTARAATDKSQNLIWRWHSDAFGVGEAESLVRAGQPELTLNLRFPGQYHDAESGLYYNYFRSYDPSMGRYTQSDPIGLLGGVNTFGYVAGNPLARLDPYGLLIVYPEDDPDFMRDVELARQYLPLLDQYFRELDVLDAELHLIRIGRGDKPRFQEELIDLEPCGTPSPFSEPSSIFWNSKRREQDS